MNLNINKNEPVMVTGATGFVASELIKKLLENGLTVHAAVRNPKDVIKVQHLTNLESGLSGKIIFFKSDLLDEGSYLKAMEGCSIVFHTASPFNFKVTDNQKGYVDPALKGTRNVLNSVNKTESVKRVILTSSCAAIYGDAVDIISYPNKTMTEEMWNSSSTSSYNAYSYSKTIAEKEAWDISKKQNNWKLVVINPCLVLGPSISKNPTSGTFELLSQIADGSMKSGAAPFEIGAVDVRDVAEAHFRAAYLESANGRNILYNKSLSMLDIANIIKNKFGDKWALPKKEAPKWLIWLIGPFIDKTLSRKMISNNFGHPWRADNSKSKKYLDMEYTPIENSIENMFQQMIDNGIAKKK
jgi:nucleoside-diphosphate-sugar epimerase